MADKNKPGDATVDAISRPALAPGVEAALQHFDEADREKAAQAMNMIVRYTNALRAVGLRDVDSSAVLLAMRHIGS